MKHIILVAAILSALAPSLRADDADLKLHLRTQQLKPDSTGHNQWATVTTEKALKPSETAIIICDMWDKHWSRGATERVGQMAPRMNEAIKAARARGVLIIHAPSDVISFYNDTPARRRMTKTPKVDPPADLKHADPRLPIDDSDGGSDTGEKPWYRAWIRQHPAIEIDQDKDGISDNGREIYSFLRARGIRNVMLMGVHTNMCVLNRSFAIKQMTRWGLNTILVRDLTDAMYNPAMPPYVSHAEGTRLVIEFIEKFWCPTILSQDLLDAGKKE